MLLGSKRIHVLNGSGSGGWVGIGSGSGSGKGNNMDPDPAKSGGSGWIRIRIRNTDFELLNKKIGRKLIKLASGLKNVRKWPLFPQVPYLTSKRKIS